MSEDNDRDGTGSSRWERREARREAERNRVQKHGASLRKVYRDAVLKRMRSKKRK